MGVLKTAKGNPVKMRSVDDLLREVDHLNQIEKNNLLEEHEKPYDPKNIPSVKDSLEGIKSMQDDEKAVGLLQKDSLCAGLIGIPFERFSCEFDAQKKKVSQKEIKKEMKLHGMAYGKLTLRKNWENLKEHYLVAHNLNPAAASDGHHEL